MSKRNRKPSAKEVERVSNQKQPEKSMWCLVEIQNKNGTYKEELVCSKHLETENGEPVSLKDLYCENKVILLHKKVPYEATILEIHRTKPLPKKKIIVDDSSDDDDEPKTKKIKYTTKDLLSSGDEMSLGSAVVDTQEEQYVEDDNTDVLNNSDIDHEEEISNDDIGMSADDQPVQSPVQSPVSITSVPKTNGVRLFSKTHPPKYKSGVAPCLQTNGFKVPFSFSSTSSKTPQHSDCQEQLNRIESKLNQLLSQKAKVKNEVHNDDEKYIAENGVNLMTIRAEDPFKYALHLMDIFFSDQEMATSCYAASKRSKKPGLDSGKISFLEDCVKKRLKLSEKQFQEVAGQIRRKCTQKCIDKARAIKKEEPQPTTDAEVLQ